MNATNIDPQSFGAMRQAMVASQLRTTAVNDPRVVTAMARVPRERFIPAEARALAYRDTAVPLGHGRALNLPMATGRLLTEAYLLHADRVLLIGAATGYAAAILAELVTSVTAVEADPALVAVAREALGQHSSVRVVEGPLPAGHPADAPYDVLVIDGAIEELPQALVDQLHPDARIVAGLVDNGVTRLAAGRRAAGGFGLVAFADADCVVLPGFARVATFRF